MQIKDAIIAWADRRLVSEWRKAHHWLSIRIAGAGAAFLLAWPVLPDEMKAALPTWLPTVGAAAVLLGAMAGRIKKQANLTEVS